VRNADGEPLAGAAITLIAPGGQQAGLGQAGHDGGYRIPVPEPGAYTLIAAAAGHAPAASTLRITPGQLRSHDVRLTRPKANSNTI
jgi:hypothetical protein